MHRPEHPSQPASHTAVPDVLKHLADSLDLRWKRYRKRLKRCQQRFSADAVHDSRVETRRLLATIELLRAFIPEDEIKKVRRALKAHLDTFDELRDTQVQLVYVESLLHRFSAAPSFRDWLRRREKGFTRETRKNIRRIKTKRLGRRIARFRKELHRQHKITPGPQAFAIALGEMDRAFALVVERCRHVRAADTRTIHRTRIAFKRFRYMVEALTPLLPILSEHHRRALQGYQSMMGDIQDAEVLRAALDKFIRGEHVEPGPARQLRDELTRRLQALIQVYMNAAAKLRQFWPVPGLTHSPSHAKPNPPTP